MSFGKYTYGTPDVRFPAQDSKLVVGNFCSIALNVKIYLGNGHGHDTSFVSTYPFGYINQHIFPVANNHSKDTNGDVVIGNDVWIGENVTILSGITIGDGAVIANNSHVIKDVEPYSVVGGNPANFIKYRFTKKQIDKLLEIKWWDWEDDKIRDFVALLCSNNIDDFIDSVMPCEKTSKN